MKETMNVHEALAELKVLGSRIEKEIQRGTFIVANRHSNTRITGLPVNEFCMQEKELFASVRSLINRRDAIKRAVTKSNAVTTVSVAGKEYTVAEAIEMKNHGLDYLEMLKNQIQKKLEMATRACDTENGRLQDRADEYVTRMYSSADQKNMADEVRKVRDDFISSQTVEIVDAIGAAKAVAELEKTIDSFKSKVDSALSVSNAVTIIEVEYETF